VNYLVTGASGFIGSYIIKALLKDKTSSIYCLVRNSSNLFRIQDSVNQLNLVEISSAKDKLKGIDFKCCIHAAWDGVLNQFKNDEIQKENLFFLDFLLDLIKNLKIKKIIALGSQAEYGVKNKAIKESDLLNPITLYGKEKVKVFLKLKRFCEQNEIIYQWLRVFSSYGPFDHSSWLIPYTILSYLKDEKPILTEGIQKWDYLYAQDLADAVIKSVLFERVGVYNLGASSIYSVKEIVTMIHQKIKPNVPLEFGHIPYPKNQIFHLEADSSLFRKRGNWDPKINLSEGLDKTIEYYKKNL